MYSTYIEEPLSSFKMKIIIQVLLDTRRTNFQDEMQYEFFKHGHLVLAMACTSIQLSGDYKFEAFSL
jgi:hypothetical protein